MENKTGPEKGTVHQRFYFVLCLEKHSVFCPTASRFVRIFHASNLHREQFDRPLDQGMLDCLIPILSLHSGAPRLGLRLAGWAQAKLDLDRPADDCR